MAVYFVTFAHARRYFGGQAADWITHRMGGALPGSGVTKRWRHGKTQGFPTETIKRADWVAQSTITTQIDMASEVFLAIFRARFDALYDASNESGLRWWINENIWDFIAPTYLRGNPFNPCTVRREGHHPKVLLWIMEEFFHISHDLTEMDRDGALFCATSSW